jgi:hypothetical protein
MYTATVQIQINAFNPIAPGGPSINATLSLPTPGPGSQTVFNQSTPTQLVVTTPKGYVGLVQVTFQLADPNNVLLGISVDPTTTPKGSSVGRTEFPSILINRDSSGSQLTVTDACLGNYANIDFDYVILVQNVPTGQIGIIDPDWDDEPGE